MTLHSTRSRMFVAAREIDASLTDAVVSVVGCVRTEWTVSGAPPWTARPPALLVLAVGEGPTGRAALTALRRQPPRAPCLILVSEGADDQMVRAAAELGDDFVIGAVRVAELEERVRRLGVAPEEREGPSRARAAGGAGRATDEIASARRRLRRDLQLRQLIGETPAFRRMVDALPRLAAREGTVLITGETGTGKELCARALHHLGPRAGRPFLAVDCGALPDHLLENELFGHARGAYTDARNEQRGLVGTADGGVLFLDEVDALSMGAQAKLLRFLQEYSYRPLGSDRLIEADVRVVAATNADLAKAVQEGTFRADLYFRLNVLQIRTIPLRERVADIVLLAEHFVRILDREGRGPRVLSAAALRNLTRHAWPGNVRELENVILRALAATDPEATEIDASAIEADGDDEEGGDGDAGRNVPHPVPRPEGARDESFRAAKERAIADFERSFVGELLQRHRGNITQAARAARKDRRALGRLVKKYLPGRSAARAPAEPR